MRATVMVISLCTLILVSSLPGRGELSGDSSQASTCGYDVSSHKANCSHLGLEKVPDNIPRDTIVLSLSFNEITQISKKSFAGLFAVEDISLRHNRIHHIDPDTFMGLTYLKVVNLVENFLQNIPSDLFTQNIHLTDIFLRTNNFQLVPELDLRAHCNLSMIDLSQNDITSALFPMALPEDCYLEIIDLRQNQIRQVRQNDFQNMKSCSVTLLELSHNEIMTVEPDSLRGHTIYEVKWRSNPLYSKGVMEVFKAAELDFSVISLNIENTNFSNLTEDIFSPLHNSSVKYLSLDENDIPVLPDNVFHHLGNVVSLSLNLNVMGEFSPTAFNGMLSLKKVYMSKCNIIKIRNTLDVGQWRSPLEVLSLDGNYISEIPSRSFVGLNKLWYLSLENNPIEVIHADSFDGLTNLNELRLNNCNLQGTTLTVNVFGQLQNLLSLDLGESKINVLNPKMSFKGLTVLHQLVLQGNHFQIASLWNSENNVSLFQDLHELNTLDLSNVVIKMMIPSECFASLRNLVTLRLANMKLPQVHPDLLTGLPELESLILDDNGINSLPAMFLRSQSKLTTLYLSRNPIAYLDPRTFKYTTNLRGLDLARTNLQVVTEQSFAPILTSLATLDMSYASLSCSCKNKWFRDWIKTSDIDFVSTETVCSYDSAPELSGKPFLDFEPALKCGPKIVLYSCVALVVAILIVSFIIIYYNRWWLNHKFFLLKLCVIGYKEIIDDEEYQFDVNIVFHDSDEGWVNDHLLTNIREEYPDAVLCVGDDNLPLGMYRLDAFVEVVDNSYKSVFVISNTSSEDNWFLTKLRIALQHVNHFKRDAVLLVFLEDIPEERLPYLIRLFLSVNRPYLQWHDDPRNEEYFWDKVMKCLKVTTRLDVTLPV